MIHGDLSEYNILVDGQGPVIIDLPQAVDAAGNNNAQAMLTRDVDNLSNFFGQFAPALRESRYGREIWLHYEAGSLTPEVVLTGYVRPTRRRSTSKVCCTKSKPCGLKRKTACGA